MSKVDNAVEQEEPLTSEEHLESILFQFVNLYERWAEDRQVTAKQGADIAKFIKEFAGHVNDFALLEEKVRGDIHARIENEAKNIAIRRKKKSCRQ
jgi:DNA-binding ferritin-like protein (Dps family)